MFIRDSHTLRGDCRMFYRSLALSLLTFLLLSSLSAMENNLLLTTPPALVKSFKIIIEWDFFEENDIPVITHPTKESQVAFVSAVINKLKDKTKKFDSCVQNIEFESCVDLPKDSFIKTLEFEFSVGKEDGQLLKRFKNAIDQSKIKGLKTFFIHEHEK